MTVTRPFPPPPVAKRPLPPPPAATRWTLETSAASDARDFGVSWSPVGTVPTPVALAVHACVRRAV